MPANSREAVPMPMRSMKARSRPVALAGEHWRSCSPSNPTYSRPRPAPHALSSFGPGIALCGPRLSLLVTLCGLRTTRTATGVGRG
jgi:hypothetical protein